MIYLDNAANTKISPIILEEMMPYLKGYGNPSSLHSAGRKCRKAIEEARTCVAKAINTIPQNIFFVNSATEGNNWVISNYNKVLCSRVEHHSILNNPKCIVMNDNTSLEQQIHNEKPDLVTKMLVCNETGEIYDIKHLTEICHNMGIPFHCDAVQAFSHIPVDVKYLGVDSLVISGHKFHAYGSGIVYLKDPSKYKPLLYGGGQEMGLRSSTENVASIVSMGKACELYNYSPERDKRCKEIQMKFYNAFSEMQDVHFNTDINHSISTTLNVGFKGVESESLMLLLDMDGICVSAGSACNSGSLEPSHVLKAINCPEEYIHQSIRLSWDDTLTDEEIEYTIESIKKNIKKVRGYI